jgi:predicted O-linked N-acetylglucosamine transferase (SPINDLY family)
LLSPQFTASPVYYFTFGALRLLSEEVDLIFFNRGDRQDWATQAFQSVAHDWIDSRSGTAEQLAQVLKSQEVDVLLDLGGWMDPVGLRALSSKPVARQFKWVGGQSATTGLRVFDGFISDRGQTPVGSDALYTEPLINLKNGYVSYTAPPYLPEPGKRPRSSEIALGVISNPAKISRAFLQDLARRLPVWSARVREERKRLKILFIEQRFRQASVRARIEAAFDPAINGGLASSVELEFHTPAGHQEFLASVAALDGIIDTWPYSGGLTTVEGLAMGVPTYWRGGMLFCERHTQAHLAYSGLDPREFQLARFDGVPQHGKRGRSLIGAGSGRLDHQELAKALHSRFSSRRSNR